MDIDFFFDPISPYAYLASTQIDALAARHGRCVRWRPLLLSVTVLEVMQLKPVPLIPLKGDYSRQDKHRLAAWLGVPLNEHGLQVSPISGLRAFLWLREQDVTLAQTFARRLCAALWVDGLDIGAVDVVCGLAAELGCDPDAVRAGIGLPDIKQALRDEVDEAVKLGVFGVPFFLADGEPFWGVDRLWMLEHWLTHHTWNPDK